MNGLSRTLLERHAKLPEGLSTLDEVVHPIFVIIALNHVEINRFDSRFPSVKLQ